MLIAAGNTPALDASGFGATLPTGAVFHVLAVTDETGRIWAPTGGTVTAAVRSEVEDGPSCTELQPGDRAIFFDVTTRNRRADVIFMAFVNAQKGGATACATFDSPTSTRVGYTLVQDRSLTTADLDASVAEGPFRTVSRTNRVHGVFKREFGQELKPRLVWTRELEWHPPKKETWVDEVELRYRTVKVDEEHFDARVQVMDRNHKVIGVQDRCRPRTGVEPVLLQGSRSADVALIEVKARPYTNFTVKGIRLQPN
ncbi:MAG TPA: hypothetical protein VKT78_00685 [Fimbriimonadaceae bacterium]|nr:hypothetical protein [Fimbriimonadaceae bacterium]